MARYPKARWLPVTGLSNDPVIIPVGVILHIDGGNASSLYEYFNGPSGGIESTLFVNKQGNWEQFRDTTNEADANADGNSWIGSDGKRYGFNSVETQGTCNDSGWNDIQLKELAEFLAWHHEVHGTKLVLATGSHGHGVGYHKQFPGWNPNGHECPCDSRVAQIPELLRRANDIVNSAGLEIIPEDVNMRIVRHVGDNKVFLVIPGHSVTWVTNPATAQGLCVITGQDYNNLPVVNAATLTSVPVFDQNALVNAIAAKLAPPAPPPSV